MHHTLEDLDLGGERLRPLSLSTTVTESSRRISQEPTWTSVGGRPPKSL